MPTVPRVTRQVATTALPGARLTASETALSAGAGVAEANADAALRTGNARAQTFGAIAGFGGQVQRAGTALGEIYLQERQRADEVALMDAENRLAERSNPLLYDPNEGALAKKGKNALGTPEATLGKFNEIASDIESGLTTNRQKAAFAKVRANRAAQFDLTLRRHVLGEMQQYEAGELKSLVDNSVNTAVANASDPARVSYELGNAVDAIERSGPRLGLGPEQVKAEVLKVQTQTHTGVIEQLVAQDRMKAATVYFEEARDAGQISGEAQARIVRALEEGSLRKNAQETFDTITATKPQDEWVKEARKIDDPKLRDAVEERVTHQLNVNERIEREQHEALVTKGKNIIDRTGDWTKIPQTEWAQLTVGESAALKAYAEHKVTQVAVKTNPAVYHALTQMATSDDPAQRAAFVKLPMMQFVDKLSTSDWQQFVDAQGKVRNGDAEAAHKLLVDPALQNKMVDEALTSMGLDPTPKLPGTKGYDDQAVYRVNEFRRSVREAVSRQEQRTGKKATDDEVQEIVDLLRTPTGRMMTQDGWFRDTYRTAYAYETAQAQASSVADIPGGEKQRIIEALRAKGKPTSDANVLQLFNTMLSITRKDR